MAAWRRLPDERIEDEAAVGSLRALSLIGRRGVVSVIGGDGAGRCFKRAVAATRGKREQRNQNAGASYARNS